LEEIEENEKRKMVSKGKNLYSQTDDGQPSGKVIKNKLR
jgi:hypothetical protein